MNFPMDSSLGQQEESSGNTPLKSRPLRSMKLPLGGDASTIKIISMNAVLGRGLFEPVG